MLANRWESIFCLILTALGTPAIFVTAKSFTGIDPIAATLLWIGCGLLFCATVVLCWHLSRTWKLPRDKRASLYSVGMYLVAMGCFVWLLVKR
jgi:hypothetical protein